MQKLRWHFDFERCFIAYRAVTKGAIKTDHAVATLWPN